MAQLEIFYKASYKVSKQDKGVRMFYLERLVKSINSMCFSSAFIISVTNGLHTDGEVTVELEDLPDYASVTPVREQVVVANARRRIRCKMCRSEAALVSVKSWDLMTFYRTELASRENMVEHGQLSPPTPAVSYSPTVSTPPGFPEESDPLSNVPQAPREDDSLQLPAVDEAEELAEQLSCGVSLTDSATKARNSDTTTIHEGNGHASTASLPDDTNASVSITRTPVASPLRQQKPTPTLSHPSELAAQVYSNPTLAALRTGTVRPTPSLKIPPNPSLTIGTSVLVNPKCSGYFVEPVCILIS